MGMPNRLIYSNSLGLSSCSVVPIPNSKSAIYLQAKYLLRRRYPGSPVLEELGRGDILFFGLYFFMTGLHALHIIAGLVFIGIVFNRVIKDRITHDNFVHLENAGLYWHLVDIIWIFLFPLFYLIT